jgi:hypothetical protein
MATAKRPSTKKTQTPAEAKEAPAKAKSSISKQATAVTTSTPLTRTTVEPKRAEEIEGAVRLRAYELFLQRGAEHGSDLEDWLRAEAEVLRRFAAAA